MCSWSKGLIALLLLLCGAIPARAQISQVPSGSGTGQIITNKAGLATYNTQPVGFLATITDGANATDCTTGGGSFKVLCQFQGGTTWQAVAQSGVAGVSTVNGNAGAVTITPANIGAVPTTATVNGHPLSANVTVSAADAGAVPTTTTVNGHPLSTNVIVSPSDVGNTTAQWNANEILGNIIPTLSSGYLHWNGTAWVFDTPAGGGNVSTSGTPTTGSLALFASGTTVGNSHCDDGVTTASTVTCSEPIALSGTEHHLDIPEEAAPANPSAGTDRLYTDSTTHLVTCLTSTGTSCMPSSGGGTTTIASGTAALGTAAIASGACASVVTVAATGVATTDAIVANPNADPTGVTGYGPSASGSLYIWKYPTAGNVNFKVCNNTSGSITPAALTLNWRVTR